MSDYLYSNGAATAERRLQGLEAIEDSSTIELLTGIGISPGWHCLEIGAGAGSIARWLADSVGKTGRVVATDVETELLDSSAYEVWRHDIERDELPTEAFDLVHLRHVLIHVNAAKHPTILRRLLGTLKPRGIMLIEESDLSSWQSCPSLPAPLRTTFAAGVDATLSVYRDRGMDTSLGARLDRLVREAGFVPTSVLQRARRISGGGDEATFHRLSAGQLAGSIRASSPEKAIFLDRFVDCLGDSNLKYQTRTTVSVTAMKPI